MSAASLLELRGAERPRVELRPPAVDTLGPEAVELAVLAGIELEPWQDDGVGILLSIRADGRWACYEYAELVGRQQGKTTGIGIARVLAGLFLVGERLILWSAHEVKTSMEAFLRLKDALLELGEEINPNTIVIDDPRVVDEPVTIKVNHANGDEGFTFSTGQRVRFVARSKGSGRGFSGDLVIIDEAFAYTRLQQSALEPTLSARPNPQVLYLSSPPIDGRSGDVLYALRKRATGKDPTLGWRDWGLDGDLDDLAKWTPDKRRKYLDDRANWAASLPALGHGRSSEESIARLRRSMDEFDFAREVLGVWPKQLKSGDGWIVIPEEVWRARGEAEGRPDGASAFALEASWPDAAFGTIGVAGHLGDELLVQVVDYRPGTAWMVRRAVELRKRHPDAVFVLDKKGPAGHLLGALEDAGFDVVTPDMGDVARAFGSFCAAVAGDEPTLRHYDQRELDDAVKTAGTRPLGDARTWARQGEGDICPVSAVTLALLGLNERSYEPWAVWD